VTFVLIAVIVVLAVAVAALGVRQWQASGHSPRRLPGERTRRILFPFVAADLSCRALDAALRLARAEDATLVPVFLARVALHLPLESPLARQAETAVALQEAIEQRATAFGVPVDARIERGRTTRHALRQTIAEEHFDRIVIAAAPSGGAGFNPEDVAWLLEHAAGEIVVVRPANDDRPDSKPARMSQLSPRRGWVTGNGSPRAPESARRGPGHILIDAPRKAERAPAH
jgi:hypothetical protein